jgi:hypothetical protein
MRKQRAHTRVNIHTEVWRGEDGIYSHSSQRLANLSVGGAFVEGAGTMVGSILNLRFRVPGTDDFVTSTAIGRNTHDGGLGVEFIDLSPDNRTRLATFHATPVLYAARCGSWGRVTHGSTPIAGLCDEV